MKESFIYPIFKDKKCLEFRIHNNIACIYGNTKGLLFFKNICYDISKEEDEYSILLSKEHHLLTDLSIDCCLKLDNKQNIIKCNNMLLSISRFIKSLRRANRFYTLNFQERDNLLYVTGTQKGFHLMGDACDFLINHPEQGHIHLENECYPLKSKSLNATIAVF